MKFSALFRRRRRLKRDQAESSFGFSLDMMFRIDRFQVGQVVFDFFTFILVCVKFEEVFECSVDSGDPGFILDWVTEDRLVRLVHLHYQRFFTRIIFEIAGIDVHLQRIVLFLHEEVLRSLLRSLNLVTPWFLTLCIFSILLIALLLFVLVFVFFASLA